MEDGATDPFADDEPASVGKECEQPLPDENPVPSMSNTDWVDQSDQLLILACSSVKDDRDDVHQLFVYEKTPEKEKVIRHMLKDRIGDNLYKLDVREAIYLAGMQNLDDTEAILRE